MTLIDTHTHPYLPEFPDPAAVIDEAVAAGVAVSVLPNVDAGTVEPLRALHLKRPRATVTALGLHPTEVDGRDIAAQLEFVKENLDTFPGLVAIGEVGMDLYWDKTFRDRQMQIFEAQLNMAAEKELPVIIHCREALDETLETITSASGKPRLVFHSFGGEEDDVDRIRKVCGDPMFGINGIVTFKNSGLRRTLPSIGLDRILLETDAPYLAPVPHRGKTNRPAYVTHVAGHIANSLGIDPIEVAEKTTANALRFFGIKL